MTKGKTLQIAEVKLSYHPPARVFSAPKIVDSKTSYKTLYQFWDKDKIHMQEQFVVMLVNRGNRVLGIYELSTGGISETIADPKLIFIAALKACASGIILAHNHPSGNLKPSDDDIKVTGRILDAGRLLGIKVLDHMIISSKGYYSFVDEGLL